MDPATLSFADWASIVYAVLSLVGLLIAFVFIVGLLRFIARLWTRSGDIFGSDSRTRLISLGISALLFPGVVSALAGAIILFIGNFFIDAPKALITNWQSALQSFCLDSSLSRTLCEGQLSSAFVGAWASAFSDSLRQFGTAYFPYGQLILMLAVWAIVATLLTVSSGAPGDESATRGKTWLQNLLDRMSDTTKQNLLFFSIIALGGYLSIAAIAAIPGLEDTATASEAVSVDQLDRQLKDALTESQSRMPQDVGDSDPLAALATYLKTNPTNDLTVSLTLEIQKELRAQALNLYRSRVQDVQARVGTLEATAVANYRASIVGRKGTLETAQHFLLIDAWYRRTLLSMESQVASCRQAIDRNDSVLGYWASSVLDQLQTAQENPVQLSALDVAQTSDMSRQVRDECQSSIAVESIPERPDLGSNLGPFSYVASWLLRTESLPLAQIVGLLGFGLLGAAVSSLVRSSPRKAKDGPLVDGLATIVIRGATAAVVVFLGVKGGLAILTPGENNPNSYVLLLICLVAAVFSEDVWRAARRQLRQRIQEGGRHESTDSATHKSASEEEQVADSEKSESDGSSEVEEHG